MSGIFILCNFLFTAKAAKYATKYAALKGFLGAGGSRGELPGYHLNLVVTMNVETCLYVWVDYRPYIGHQGPL